MLGLSDSIPAQVDWPVTMTAAARSSQPFHSSPCGCDVNMTKILILTQWDWPMTMTGVVSSSSSSKALLCPEVGVIALLGHSLSRVDAFRGSWAIHLLL